MTTRLSLESNSNNINFLGRAVSQSDSQGDEHPTFIAECE